MKKLGILKKQSGFTLIELMLALIVLGLIIAGLVNYFSNPIKDASVVQAATKIADDMRSIDEAASKYLTDKATEVSGTDFSQLTSNGYLKMIPVPPSQAKNEGFGDTYAYAYDTTTYTSWGGVTPDKVAVLDGINVDVCKKINEKFAGAGESDAPPASAVGTKDIQCFGTDAPYTVIKPIFVK